MPLLQFLSQCAPDAVTYTKFETSAVSLPRFVPKIAFSYSGRCGCLAFCTGSLLHLCMICSLQFILTKVVE